MASGLPVVVSDLACMRRRLFLEGRIPNETRDAPEPAAAILNVLRITAGLRRWEV